MVTVLGDTNGDLLAVRVTGKLTDQDFDNYRRLVREKMNVYGTARLYFEMLAFDGWEPGSFVENAVFDILHREGFGKVAMVGEREWQNWAARLADIVKKGRVRFFPVEQRQLALSWLRSIE